MELLLVEVACYSKKTKAILLSLYYIMTKNTLYILLDKCLHYKQMDNSLSKLAYVCIYIYINI